MIFCYNVTQVEHLMYDIYTWSTFKTFFFWDAFFFGSRPKIWKSWKYRKPQKLNNSHIFTPIWGPPLTTTLNFYHHPHTHPATLIAAAAGATWPGAIVMETGFQTMRNQLDSYLKIGLSFKWDMVWKKNTLVYSPSRCQISNAPARYLWSTLHWVVTGLTRLLSRLALPIKSSAMAQLYARGLRGFPPRCNTHCRSIRIWWK